ncbi:MAG TPA: hypothetical protein VMV82_09095 [Candidatus Dormibacteraeota bacterium]|nr:hypothetical protein [Candidatus Dormibacteraeota bacterium]
MITIAIAILFVLGIALGIYAVVAPRPSTNEPTLLDQVDLAPLLATSEWTNEAGHEFAGLSESARCDLIFAVAALDDERSSHLLEVALQDPNEAVALAAAHALAGSGRAAAVERFLAQHPGDRAERIVSTLSLLIVPSREEAVPAGR